MSKRSLLMTALFAGCFLGGDPAGEGDKARAGFQQAAPILVAIEAFRSNEGRYPDSLGELVPAMLDRAQLVLRAPGSGAYPFEYELLGDEYKLAFRYGGPGMNVCTFDRETLAWACYGYF